MNVFKKVEKLLLLSVCACSFSQPLFALPLNNIYDTQPIYSQMLSDKFYKKRDSHELRIQLSPFYQHANTARDGQGKKVPGGDRLGQMNMFGLFFDAADLARPKTFNTDLSYATAQRAKDAIGQTVLQAIDPSNRYALDVDSTDKANFKPQKNPFAYFSVPISYEKIGMRGQVNYDLGMGLGFALRAGAVDIKCKARAFDIGAQFLEDSQLADGSTLAVSAAEIYDALFADAQRDAVAQEFGINLKPFHQSSVEDVHAQIYWHYPIQYAESASEGGMTVTPYLAVGAWLPTAKKPNQDSYFAVPFGNQAGEYGLTIDGAIGFDFPVVPQAARQSMGFSLGGGLLLFNEHTELNQRFPSTDLQVGIFPWKAAKVLKRPGETWYFNVGFKAEQFLEGFSFYADYTYTNHIKDRLTIKEAKTPVDRQALFDAGVASMQNNSSWKNQQVAVSMSFDMTKSVTLSGAAQAHISGVRVIRAVTILGGLTVSF